jgi:hypothetical protein
MGIINKAVPYFEKLGPKAMAKFSNILKQSKNDHKALSKIKERLSEILPANFSDKP